MKELAPLTHAQMRISNDQEQRDIRQKLARKKLAAQAEIMVDQLRVKGLVRFEEMVLFDSLNITDAEISILAGKLIAQLEWKLDGALIVQIDVYVERRPDLNQWMLLANGFTNERSGVSQNDSVTDDSEPIR